MIKDEVVATGRRKTAVASVRLRPGKGHIFVNGMDFDQYFQQPLHRSEILAPLKKTETEGRFDMIIRVRGGGKEGQVIAARLGVARALEKENENRRPALKSEGYLTRDPRRRERKKYGKAGARKSFQFSKR